jgi:hypothetical protein
VTILAILKTGQTVEGVWAGAFLLLVAGAMLIRSGRGKRPAAAPEIPPEIVDALSVYLGGNRDSGRLRALAAANPDRTREAIFRFQALVAGRREELCDLTIELGYVERWCEQAHSAKVKERREAFSYISAVADYEPVRRLVGNIPAKAVRDPDEQIRLEAARILLAAGIPEDVVRVFEGALSDTPGVRLGIAAELGRYATLLCHAAVPRALRSENPREVLKLLVSWERALPLRDVRPLAEHPDPEVRVEAMRLLQFLPTTPENRAALLSGMTDEDHDVSAAASAAAGRLRFPNPESPESHAAGGPLVLVPDGGNGC